MSKSGSVSGFESYRTNTSNTRCIYLDQNTKRVLE